jgi:coproporphyrinogen III oxidase
MNPTTKTNAEKLACLKEAQEAIKKSGSGVKMLPVVRYQRKLWFFDKRLRQLRNIYNPHDFIDLNDFEMQYFISKIGDETP